MSKNAETLAGSHDWGQEPHDGSIVAQAREQQTLDTLINNLIALVQGPDANLSMGAIEELGEIEEAKRPDVVQLLITSLNRNEYRDYVYGGFYSDEDDMRSPASSAAAVLGTWHVEEAVEPLWNKINTQSNDFARNEAIKALGLISTPEAVEFLQQIINSTEKLQWGVYDVTRVTLGELAVKALK